MHMVHTDLDLRVLKRDSVNLAVDTLELMLTKQRYTSVQRVSQLKVILDMGAEMNAELLYQMVSITKHTVYYYRKF